MSLFSEGKDRIRNRKKKDAELQEAKEKLAVMEEELSSQYSDLKRAQDATREIAERYRQVTEGANDILWEWNPQTSGEYISDRFFKLLGYTNEEFYLRFKSYHDVIHPEDAPALLRYFRNGMDGGEEYFTAEFRAGMKNGNYKWLLSHSKAFRDGNGKVIRIAGSFTDITQRKLYEEEIKQLAYFDYLTGLPNRTMIFEEGGKLIEACRSSRKAVAFLHINFDDFSTINHTFGHEYGNGVLTTAGTRLTEIVSLIPGSLAGRLSGDEFIVFLPCGETAYARESRNRLESFVEHIFAALRKTVQIENYSINPFCSIGISVFPWDGSSFEELLEKSELALSKAKSDGKNRYLHYNDEMRQEAADRLKMESRLKTSVELGELRLYFQPQMEIRTKKLIGFEALLRWFSPIYGLVNPMNFIPLAEETGLIITLGNWVIDQSFAFAKKINTGSEEIRKVSFNVSPTQLLQANFVSAVLSSAQRNGADPSMAGIEITESMLLNSFNETYEKIQKLREAGCKILIDDFGTGYSSLSYLKQLPVDVLKIDKCFVDDMERKGMEYRLMSSIISLAKSIGMEVIAEGVETQAQLDILQEFGCEYIQGYLLSKPLPEEDAVQFLHSAPYLSES